MADAEFIVKKIWATRGNFIPPVGGGNSKCRITGPKESRNRQFAYCNIKIMFDESITKQSCVSYKERKILKVTKFICER